MSWLSALVSLVGSLASAVPKVLEAVREWRLRSDAERERAEKDKRNRAAIEAQLNKPADRP